VRERLSQAPDNVIVGAFTDDALVGSVGLFREAREKTRHRAWIWGVYLTPSARGRGLGVQMMEQAAAHGRTLDGVCQVCLSVSAMAPDAQKLYERVGFRAWGKEPRAMCVGGQLLDEVHMILPFGE
jgi:GNAT superfamily N-acetyltransferase